jgi:hypothetical protein
LPWNTTLQYDVNNFKELSQATPHKPSHIHQGTPALVETGLQPARLSAEVLSRVQSATHHKDGYQHCHFKTIHWFHVTNAFKGQRQWTFRHLMSAGF